MYFKILNGMSTVKAYSRAQNRRGVYLSLIDHHVDDYKYRSTMKKRSNLLQNIKWNGRSYSLEKHEHCQAIEDLTDTANYIIVSIPDDSQRIQFLVDSINYQDATL